MSKSTVTSCKCSFLALCHESTAVGKHNMSLRPYTFQFTKTHFLFSELFSSKGPSQEMVIYPNQPNFRKVLGVMYAVVFIEGNDIFQASVLFVLQTISAV